MLCQYHDERTVASEFLIDLIDFLGALMNVIGEVLCYNRLKLSDGIFDAIHKIKIYNIYL